MRKKLKWKHKPFEIPKEILEEWRKIGERGFLYEKKWNNIYNKKNKKIKEEFTRVINDKLPKNFDKIFYYSGKQAVTDIINFKIFTSSKVEKKLIKLMESYKDKVIPTMTISANTLMTKYNIPEGKILGNKLKMIEEVWVNSGFKISDKQVLKVVKD